MADYEKILSTVEPTTKLSRLLIETFQYCDGVEYMQVS